MTSDAAARYRFLALVVIAVTVVFVAPWVADAIFIALKAFLAARSAGAYTFGAN